MVETSSLRHWVYCASVLRSSGAKEIQENGVNPFNSTCQGGTSGEWACGGAVGVFVGWGMGGGEGWRCLWAAG